MTLTPTTSTYYDLGFYYSYQNLVSLGSLSTHSITITGTGPYAVNLWLNSQDWTWTPNGIGAQQYVSQGTDGAYGLGPANTGSSLTINSASSFFIAAQGSALTGCSGNTYTIAQLIGGACAGIGSATPFALWVGLTSTAPTTQTATITSIVSTPYP